MGENGQAYLGRVRSSTSGAARAGPVRTRGRIIETVQLSICASYFRWCDLMQVERVICKDDAHERE